MIDLFLTILVDAFWSALAAIGFAMLFNVPRRTVIACALTGAAGHAIRALLIVIATAFVAGLIASSASILHLSDHAQTALVASVLLLVPGVHLINSIQDIIKGHMVIGLVRGFTGLVISLCIALGLLLAMQLAGVSGI